MSEQPQQVSRAVLGFPRGRRVRRALAAVALLAAVASLAPPWWWQAAVAAGRWAGRHWPVVVLVLVAGALSVGGRRRPSAVVLGRRPRTPAMPLLVHVALLLGLAAAVAAGVGVVLWDVLGQPTDRPQAPGAPLAPTWGVQERLDAVKVVLTVVGGVGAVVALTVAYRRQRLTEADSHREDTKVVLDRYTKAAELLGAADASVRVAGVYAFAALANDAPEARQGCIDVLCAYLRQPYGTAADPGPHDPGQERQVRLTVIRLIRDNLHLADDDPRSWRGHDFDFTGAVFDGGDLAGATFAEPGRVTFAEATITGGLSFDRATVAGGAISFDRARFAGGAVSFKDARLTGGRVSFVDARFVGGTVSLAEARFAGGVVDLSGVDPESSTGVWPTGTPAPPGLRLPADRRIPRT
ncbi:pentapeptide repeat-containing protein [Saccharothrix texasensis]|uniref:Pentapeptide repeat protein n=1 Tax=Saccharothrix texasensis TaxID=103734 RepID=A0A3N1H2C8_9PSEU|nr:pentapeptide repeat-containing protein [Saccharothrix texasensis]ROP36661.1 pentapeptide repeat protein [Saccharothrix texasensis]